MAGLDERWQLFAENGKQIPGASIDPEEARTSGNSFTGDVHVWIWRTSVSGDAEVLLQKRSIRKKTYPGKHDISFAGHINAGETFFEAVKREGDEELGLVIDESKLKFLFSYRHFINGFKWVYALEDVSGFVYDFKDGEVESLRWVTLAELANMTNDAQTNGLVPHLATYFDWVISGIMWLHENH